MLYRDLLVCFLILLMAGCAGAPETPTTRIGKLGIPTPLACKDFEFQGATNDDKISALSVIEKNWNGTNLDIMCVAMANESTIAQKAQEMPDSLDFLMSHIGLREYYLNGPQSRKDLTIAGTPALYGEFRVSDESDSYTIPPGMQETYAAVLIVENTSYEITFTIRSKDSELTKTDLELGKTAFQDMIQGITLEE